VPAARQDCAGSIPHVNIYGIECYNYSSSADSATPREFVLALKPATEYAFEFLRSWKFSLNEIGRLGKSVWP